MCACGTAQPLDRLIHRLAAELESVMMNRQKELGSRIASHAPGFLGSAVHINPGVIRAHGHNSEIYRPRRPYLPERRRNGCVAAEQNPVPPGFEQIAVIAAICVG